MIPFQDLGVDMLQIFYKDMDHETTLAYRYDVLKFHYDHFSIPFQISPV